MPTGDFWNVENPEKPWGLWDPEAQLPIPFDWAAWLTDEGATYVSHVIEFPEGVLELVSSSQTAGIIRAHLRSVPAVTFVSGQKYPVTCSITATAGALTLKDDRTVWLKIKER